MPEQPAARAANRPAPVAFRVGLLAGVSAACLLAGAPAWAADPTSPAAVTAAGITVTSERRETKLQQTPIAETAIGAPAIEANRIVSLQDVALIVPNMTYTQFSSQESYFSIRGTLINNNAAGWDDAVATFIDDVPTTGLGDVNPDLYDLASIEVLRGPQGTLFGRNATGGAVIIRTQPPSFEFGGKAEGTYGAYNLGEARALVTGPLASNLAGKLVVDFTHQDDYINNVFLHDKTAGTDMIDVRGQLLWRPADKVEVLLSADYLHDWSGGYPTRLLANFQPQLFAPLSYSPYDTNQAFNGFQHRDIAGLSARVTWDSPWGTLTSITGYRYVDAKFPNVIDGDPQNQLPTVGLVHDTQESQEVRLASPSDQRLTWVAGLFYLHSDKSEGGPIGFFFNPNTVAGLFSAANNYVQNSLQSVATDSFAAFGEADYAFTPTLKLTLGGRASVERKGGRSVVTYSIVDIANLPPADVRYSHTWDAFTPKVTLTFQPNHDFMLYGTVSEGFKSGGYDLSGSAALCPNPPLPGQPCDPIALVDAALAKPFDQETVWNYEIGEKLTALDQRLTFDTAVFDDEYHNLQTSQLVIINSIPIPQTGNAGNARVAGVEIESQYAPADWVDFALTYAYMDARFTSVEPTHTQGNRIPYAPKDQVHAAVNLHYPLPSDAGRIDFAFDYTYHTKVFFDNANSAPSFLQRRSIWNGIVNAHLEYTSRDQKWQLSAWGKNIFAKEPVLHAADVTVLFQSLNEFLSGAPESLFLVKYYPVRTWGVTVRRTF